MKKAKISLREILNDITPEERAEARLSFQISNRLDSLMQKKDFPRSNLQMHYQSDPARSHAGGAERNRGGGDRYESGSEGRGSAKERLAL